MNCERYSAFIDGRKVRLYDEVPAMLYHIFKQESMGKYFTGDDGDVAEDKVKAWLCRE